MARRKIYDVKPPKAVKKAENSIKEFFAEDLPAQHGKTPSARTMAEKKNQGRRKKEAKPFLKPVAIGSAAILLLLCVFLYFKLQKVDVKIWPKVETLSFEQAIIADKSAVEVDTAKFVIPAKYFETEKSASEDFLATGNADNAGKASGTITVSNKYNPPSPFTLKSGTHSMSDSGKLFVSLQKIVIPAAKKSGSKIIAGTVDITVQAVEGGESYNIAPSNFSIPGLKGTAYYFSVSASSSKAMTGGQEGKIKKVTADDIQTAKDTVSKKIIADAISDLNGQVSEDYVLLDNAIFTEITSASALVKAGTVVPNFTYKATVKAKAMVFKKSDLDDFSKQFIISQLPDGKTLLDNSLKTDYTAKTVDIFGGKISLNSSFSSGIHQNVDKNSLGLSLLGQNSSQIAQTINNVLGENASKTEVKFWPFWTSKAPNNQKAINIYLQFE